MKDYYVKFADGNWVHRHPMKMAVNPILRKIQFWTDTPYVIASNTEFKDGIPHFVRFELCRVRSIKY